MRKILFQIYKRVAKPFSRRGIGNFYPIRVAHNFIISHLKPTFVEIGEHKMFLDSKDSLGISISEIHEPSETELVKKEIKNGDVVLDIGAHIGYYTLIFAKLVGEGGKIFAFEPDPTSFSLLKKNVEINGYKNRVVLVHKAVSSKTGKIKLCLSDRQSIEVEAIQLDEYFKNYNERIDFIKMDIEGAEGGVLQGMSNLLKKNKSVKIMTEFYPDGFKGYGVEPEEYLKLLVEHGFKIYDVNENEKRKPVNIPNLLEIYTPEKMNLTNLLCIREK